MISSALSLSGLVLAAQALRIPFTQLHTQRSLRTGRTPQALFADTPSTCSDSTCGQLSDTLDVVYFSTISVGSKQFQVQLDTGSSDLWVNASLQPVPEAIIMQDLVVSNVYGDGSNYTGPVAFADVQFHGFEVKNQSFTYATQSENDNTAALNLTGLIGLSFDSISHNDRAVSQSTGSKTLGQTFLSNVFASNSSLQPFISFILSRGADLNSTAQSSGAFTIAEIEQGYEAIQNSQAVPLFPQGTIQWTVAVDSVAVNGKNLQVSSTVQGASNVVALLDTGTSALLVPDQLAQSLYSSMPNVQSFTQQGQTTYIIPCDQEPPKLVITIGGQAIPIHPLDSNTIFQTFQTPQGSLVSVCAGGIVGYSASSNFEGSGFDLLLGDSFLRNAYTMFNFASSASTPPSTPPSTASTSSPTDGTGRRRRQTSSTPPTTSSNGPFVKILGITDPSSASSDFTSTRQKQLSLAPAVSDSQLQDLLNGSGDYTPVNTPPLGGSSSGSGSGSSSGGGNNKGSASSLRTSPFVVALLSICMAICMS